MQHRDTNESRHPLAYSKTSSAYFRRWVCRTIMWKPTSPINCSSQYFVWVCMCVHVCTTLRCKMQRQCIHKKYKALPWLFFLHIVACLQDGAINLLQLTAQNDGIQHHFQIRKCIFVLGLLGFLSSQTIKQNFKNERVCAKSKKHYFVVCFYT